MSNLYSNLAEDQISAVHALEGRILKTGWTVTEKRSLNLFQQEVIFQYVTLWKKAIKKGF